MYCGHTMQFKMQRNISLLCHYTCSWTVYIIDFDN